jgi:hypothetical protein
MNDAVTQFMAAVKAKDLDRMGMLWGDQRGPAATYMKAEDLKKRVSVLQIYLAHDGYRILEGPQPVPGQDNQRTFRVELQRRECNVSTSLDVIRVKNGGWLVYNINLATLPNPANACKPKAAGTGPGM